MNLSTRSIAAVLVSLALPVCACGCTRTKVIPKQPPDMPWIRPAVRARIVERTFNDYAVRGEKKTIVYRLSQADVEFVDVVHALKQERLSNVDIADRLGDSQVWIVALDPIVAVACRPTGPLPSRSMSDWYAAPSAPTSYAYAMSTAISSSCPLFWFAPAQVSRFGLLDCEKTRETIPVSWGFIELVRLADGTWEARSAAKN